MSCIRHDAIRMNRRNNRRREAEQQYFADGTGTAADTHPRMASADTELRAQQLRRAVRCLPQNQAELIILHIWHELSFAMPFANKKERKRRNYYENCSRSWPSQ